MYVKVVAYLYLLSGMELDIFDSKLFRGWTFTYAALKLLKANEISFCIHLLYY